METKYTVNTKFRVGEKVRVRHDYTFFSPNVRGVDMTVLEVVREDVDGTEAVFYRCDREDPVHGPTFNEFELVGLDA